MTQPVAERQSDERQQGKERFIPPHLRDHFKTGANSFSEQENIGSGEFGHTNDEFYEAHRLGCLEGFCNGCGLCVIDRGSLPFDEITPENLEKNPIIVGDIHIKPRGLLNIKENASIGETVISHHPVQNVRFIADIVTNEQTGRTELSWIMVGPKPEAKEEISDHTTENARATVEVRQSADDRPMTPNQDAVTTVAYVEPAIYDSPRTERMEVLGKPSEHPPSIDIADVGKKENGPVASAATEEGDEVFDKPRDKSSVADVSHKEEQVSVKQSQEVPQITYVEPVAPTQAVEPESRREVPGTNDLRVDTGRPRPSELVEHEKGAREKGSDSSEANLSVEQIPLPDNINSVELQDDAVPPIPRYHVLKHDNEGERDQRAHVDIPQHRFTEETELSPQIRRKEEPPLAYDEVPEQPVSESPMPVSTETGIAPLRVDRSLPPRQEQETPSGYSENMTSLSTFIVPREQGRLPVVPAIHAESTSQQHADLAPVTPSLVDGDKPLKADSRDLQSEQREPAGEIAGTEERERGETEQRVKTFVETHVQAKRSLVEFISLVTNAVSDSPPEPSKDSFTPRYHVLKHDNGVTGEEGERAVQVVDIPIGMAPVIDQYLIKANFTKEKNSEVPQENTERFILREEGSVYTIEVQKRSSGTVIMAKQEALQKVGEKLTKHIGTVVVFHDEQAPEELKTGLSTVAPTSNTVYALWLIYISLLEFAGELPSKQCCGNGCSCRKKTTSSALSVAFLFSEANT